MRSIESITLVIFFILLFLTREGLGQKIELSAEIKDQNCATGQYGQIDLGVSGGTPPYKIAWDNGSTLANIDHLIAGNYTVKVVDQNGTQASKTFWIKNESGPKITVKEKGWTSFERGNIKLEVVDSNGAIKVFWPGIENAKDKLEVLNLNPGFYAVIVYDSDNCSAMINNIEINRNGE